MVAGPPNNYVMHSIARTVELLREKKGARRSSPPTAETYTNTRMASTANEPPDRDFSVENCKRRSTRCHLANVFSEFAGDATIESYTVMFNGDEPAIGHVACRTANDDRTWVNTADPDIMNAMLVEEFCRPPVRVKGPDELTILG
ncbi:MAG: hypothetical protein Ct9H300mP8_12440 [Gammaproteobacteria bacterium]|nr:MAG: hypothetical protein Ct9H300mP8_12440 [Gammaproteobacteria bacterium]